MNYVVIRKPTPSSPEHAWEIRVVSITVQGLGQREAAIAAIQKAFADQGGTYYIAPFSTFRHILAQKQETVTYA